MPIIKAILTKPLDGQPEGTPRDFDQVDFDRLRDLGAVRAADAADEKKAPAAANKMAPAVSNKDGVPAADGVKVERDPLDHDKNGRKGGSLPKTFKAD